MIQLTCPHCQAVLKVSDDKAGRMGKCPKCQARITVPAAEASSWDEPASAPQPEPALDVGEQVRMAVGAPDWNRLQGPKRLYIPNYGGVKFLGTLYTILGWITCAVGVIVFLVMAIGSLGAGIKADSSGGAILAAGGMMGLLLGAAIVLAGLMQVGFGQLFYCIRDMARNSFYLRNMTASAS